MASIDGMSDAEARVFAEKAAVEYIKSRQQSHWLSLVQSFIQELGPVMDGGPMEKFFKEEVLPYEQRTEGLL